MFQLETGVVHSRIELQQIECQLVKLDVAV